MRRGGTSVCARNNTQSLSRGLLVMGGGGGGQ